MEFCRTDGVNIPTFNGYGITFDSQGKRFIVYTFNNRIQKYETDGNLITQWGNMGTGDGELDSPHDLVMTFKITFLYLIHLIIVFKYSLN